MKCFNCGKTIDEGAIICPYCKKEQGISRELFEAAKANDQKACAALYNLCYGNVYYTVKSMVKDEDTIQDIVQDTFIQAFRSMDWMEYMEGRFQAWIRRIAHNTTVNYIKKKKPLLFSEMETDDEDSGVDFKDERQENLPEAVIDRNETARLIQEILDTLSEDQRLAVGMYYYEQKSVSEIAKTMGVSEGTIKSRLNYGRKKIKDKVEELEKKGTKLYGLSPIPFLLFLFWNQGVQTTEVPNTHTLQLVQQALSTAQKSGAAAANVSAAATEQTAAVSEIAVETAENAEIAGKTGLLAAKGLGLKIAGGVVVLGLACGGIVYSATGRNTGEKNVVQLTTDSELPAETESDPETESESETVIVEEPTKQQAMISDVPDWEAEELIVLGKENLFRSEVTSITFLDSSDELTGYSEDMVWDVSEAGDGSVMAYAVENAEEDYALYIVSDYGVYVNADCSYMFAYYSSVSTISFNGLFNTEYVTDMSGLFSEDDALVQVDLAGWNTASVMDMNNMFYGCASLTNLDLTGFDTSNVLDMNSMFCGCTSLQEVDVSLWNTASVTDMSYMFQGCEALASLNLSGFNTMGVENMTYMFEGCHTLGTLDLSSFQTANVTDMSYMFQGCYELVTLDVSGFDTAGVTDMNYMFEGCEMLESLNLSSFDTSEVLSMSSMFEACASLTSLDVSNFDTANVQFMDNMFRDCAQLTSLDVSSFRTSNVGNMNGMFSGCESLTTLDVSNFDTSNVGDMSEMFYNCTSLSIDLSSFDLSNVYNVDNMTEGCLSVTGLEE